MGIIKNCMNNEDIKEYGKNLLEEAVLTICGGDVASLCKLLADIVKTPFFVREQIFWQNFMDYLDNACYNPDDLRKLSQKLAENGKSIENTKRLLKIIDDVGTKEKSIYIANLTRACCSGSVTKAQFFKLSQCVIRLTEEDLDFLKDNISKKVIRTDEEYIDDFRNCGLLKEVDGGFVYTKRAYELKYNCLLYGQDVEIPTIPERQMVTGIYFEEISDDEVLDLFKNND